MVNIAVVNLYNLNCTDTVYIECKVAYWLWRTIPLTLFTIGVLGNIMNFVVLSRLRMRQYSTTVYLIFLAGSDMTFLFFGLLPDTLFAIMGIRFADYSEFFCRIRTWVIYTTGMFSIWLLGLLTLERVLLTKAPFVSRSRLTPKVSLVVSVTSLVLIALVNIHSILGFKHHSSKTEIRKEFGDELFNVLPFPCTYASKSYKEFFDGTWALIILLLFNVLPASIILIGNVTIAIDIISRRRRLKAHHKQTITSVTSALQSPNDIVLQIISTNCNGNKELSVDETPKNKQEEMLSQRNISQETNTSTSLKPYQITRPTTATNKENKTRSASRMLFTLSIFFMMTSLPYTSYNVVKTGYSELNEKELAVWQLITVIVLICGWCNYSFNFFMYFVSGTLFKQEWKKIIEEGKRKLRNIFS